MIIHAQGDSACIDLFDHHLVITRQLRGMLIGSQEREQLIPLASIKSVQFQRPGFLAPGRIILAVADSTSKRPGTFQDPNTVLFAKRQLPAFERVYHAIREAIATPSIERIAMAAQRREPVSYRPPSPAASDIVEHVPRLANAGEQFGARTSTPYDHRDQDRMRAESRPTVKRAMVRWWETVPPIAKFTVAGCAAALLLTMCTPGEQSTSADGDSTDSAVTNQPADGQPPSTQAMITAWSLYTLGERRDKEFPLIDGPGKPGEFCSAAGGHAMLVFGDHSPKEGVAPFFDEFSKFDDRTGMELRGRFWFDQANNRLTLRNLMQDRPNGHDPHPVADMTLATEPAEPGVVRIDGTAFHYCVI